jgi:hypothetical protein
MPPAGGIAVSATAMHVATSPRVFRHLSIAQVYLAIA